MEKFVHKDALFRDHPNGRLVFVMTCDPESSDLTFYLGIGQGLNDAIDVNNAIAHGMKLPDAAGISIFFGDWQ